VVPPVGGGQDFTMWSESAQIHADSTPEGLVLPLGAPYPRSRRTDALWRHREQRLFGDDEVG
jgi:hypothetical protein